MGIDSVSGSFWFILLAYIAAFLPWTALSATDYIGPKWKTVKDTRNEGLRNVLLTVVPACYIVAYIVVQGMASDYTEMCSALVALVFSVLHLLRTAWGLWQLRYFRRWVSSSIDALDAMGVPYCLENKRVGTRTSTETADDVLVNETIIDNQLMHGEARCYLKYSDLSLQSNHGDTSPFMSQVHLVFQCIRFVLLWPVHQLGVVFGQRSYKLEQVPLQPVNVWLNWSVAFASQGLGNWMKEFSVLEDPKNQPGYDDMTARERFDRRAQHFSSEVLASAWLQLWPELSLAPHSASPLHWGVWDEKSNMADGRLVKAELFERAVRSGEALPFGAPHAAHLFKTSGTLGYHAYRRMLAQVVNDLPVQAEFNSHIEGFDVEKLEWLTTLLYLGTIAMNIRRRDNALRDHSNTRDPGSSTTATIDTEQGDRDGLRDSRSTTATTETEQADRSDDTRDSHASTTATTETEQAYRSDDTRDSHASTMATVPMVSLAEERDTKDTGPDDSEVANSQALANLRTQLNLPKPSTSSTDADGPDSISLLLQCASIPIKGPCNGYYAEENRHVLKVGEMIDVWLALVAGEQISFIYDMNGSSFWEDVCCGSDNGTESEDQVCDAMEMSSAMQSIHAEVEKRRLYCNIANKEHYYDHMDQFVTFMGYRMETVRSRLARWVQDQDGPILGDCFRPMVRNESAAIVELTNEFSQALLATDMSCSLLWRSVQTRLLWELQQGLAKVNNDGPQSTSNVALCILSFPSLSLEVGNRSSDYASCVADQGSVYVKFCPCLSEAPSPLANSQTVTDLPEVKICPIGGPQHCHVTAKFWKIGQNLCVITSVNLLEEGSRFEWTWWRNAFLGRLLGMKEWQEQRNIPSAELQLTMGKMNRLLQVLTARTKEKISVWPGWKPFRFCFTQFELEGKGLLKRQSVIERVGPTHAQQDSVIGIGAFSRVQVEAVSYSDTSPVVLRHAYLLLKETLSEDYVDANTASEDVGVNYLMEMAAKCQEENNDIERAALLFEIAATNHGEGSALERCIDISIDRATQTSPASRGVEILENFVAKLLRTSTYRPFQLSLIDRDKMTNYVLPSCWRLMDHFGDQLEISSRLGLLFDVVCWSDPERFTAHVLSALHMLYCLSKSTDALQAHAVSLWHTGASDSFNANIRGGVNRLTAAQGESMTKNDDTCLALVRDCFQFCKQVLQTALYESKIPRRRSEIANYLAWLLHTGDGGGGADTREAVALYKRAIEEDRCVPAMNNLAFLLETGGEGVEANAREAVSLYRRAIEESNDVRAMNNLGTLLEEGREGVEQNVCEAVALYRRAIEEGKHAPAMHNLGSLLYNGGDGVDVDPREAVALFRRAIHEGNDVPAMSKLAEILHKGGDGVEANASEAVALYRRAIEEGNEVSAMNNLAFLLSTGENGVEADAREAVALYRRAITEGNNVATVYNLACLLETGGDGVDANPREAVSLYRRAVEEGNHVLSMNNLATLLYTGGDGVEADAREAFALYRRAITEGNNVAAMFCLACLLETGGDGVDADAREAVALYERAINEGYLVPAMYMLAKLLETGADGVDANEERAALLYEQAGDFLDTRERLAALRRRLG